MEKYERFLTAYFYDPVNRSNFDSISEATIALEGGGGVGKGMDKVFINF